MTTAKDNKVWFGDNCCLVDDEDADLISKYKWYLSPRKHTTYLQTHHYVDGKRCTLYLHRLIIGAEQGQLVDHKNGNGLDNRRENLRFSTPSQNNMNQKGRSGTSKYKGVSYHTKDKLWAARIKLNRRSTHLGYFKLEEDAAKAYDQAALEYFGEFARLNFE
jgi:hypothetical protein